MIRYLENAHGSNISGNWGPHWDGTHGETSSTSKATFYIGLLLTSNGEYHSAILVTVQGDHQVPVQDTTIFWGTEQPDLLEVLNRHKEQFNITPSTPLPEPEPEPAATPEWAY
jgi:hypothetical protein